jgi:hypothetical protein
VTVRVGSAIPMDVNELMKMAWESVEQSGVPESLQADAFKEAVAYLKSQDGEKDDGDGGSDPTAIKRQAKRRGGGRTARRATETPDEPRASVSEEDFFKALADESGVEEHRLRDCLQLTSAGSVHVTPPTRNLGSSKKAQA